MAQITELTRTELHSRIEISLFTLEGRDEVTRIGYEGSLDDAVHFFEGTQHRNRGWMAKNDHTVVSYPYLGIDTVTAPPSRP